MPDASSRRSLQDLMDEVPDLVDYFANDTESPHGRNKPGLSPVPPEFTNWRDEQRAWRESVVLLDQSHHMPEMFVSGPDAKALLSRVGVNSLKTFPVLRAKQFLGCNHRGQVIGECVLEHVEEGLYELISGMPLQDWVHYVAESEGFDVAIERDPPTSPEHTDRLRFRFGTDGPNAEALFREVVEEDPGEIKFFHMARVRITGCAVFVLRHGMAGHKGVEYSGAAADGPRVLAALLEAGERHGLRRGGATTYYSTLGETGWIGLPVPAIYSDPEMEGFRRWLPADSWQGRVQLGGSHRPDDISGFYVTPWDLNLGRIVKFDHDFIGREALEATACDRHRRKMTLVWDDEEVMRIQRSLYGEGEPFKYMTLPIASYAMNHWDAVLDAKGRQVGMCNFTGYTVNERKMLSVAILDADAAEVGTDLRVRWGEPDGGSHKAHVERHRQTDAWVTVGPNPYARAAQEMKNARLARGA